MSTPEKKPGSNFIRTIVNEDNASGKHAGKVHTRFPPEPNGYLHVGHAKSICLNFGLAKEYQGQCNLRFDDTNPVSEDPEFVKSIQADVKWLGFDWEDRLFHASDYFQQFYDYAEQLIKVGKAYVESLSAEEIRTYRGTLTEPGKPSPYRDRSVTENLDLFRRMKAGEFADGTHIVRAKIDMASPNINMRDPAIYRIRKAEHHTTGNAWCIYPMYDYAHCISDALEKITHSICTLEFEDHRPLYDWFLDQLGFHQPRPQQIEFARLDLSYTITSKRKLKALVDEKHVSGWDDPRMPTISGMRRRGYPPAALRDFCERIGVARAANIVDMGVLEFCVREDLEKRAGRVLGVLNPIKIVLEDYPEGKVETIEAPFHPQDPTLGTRQVPFSREVYIEADDFMEEAPKGYFRMVPGGEVRLRNAYIVKCKEVIKDAHGAIVELRCSHDPETLGKNPTDGRKVKGIIHWVSASHSLPAEVRLYDRLYTVANPGNVKDGEHTDYLNPSSLVVMAKARVEPSLRTAKPDQRFQFERLGYFCTDRDSTPEKLVFNRVVSLRDTYGKDQQKG
ncbi:MAG: glutamine--tRNA ligase/YqeY domain fusion protein [Proteobacteria bacterium]|nr:glutamine--tRNA ligase/YqeY domain fusion protein [Pseudomonadota bacterium]